ncbi:MAG: hypothetical protein ACPHO4_10460 [Longimicrobiales bacterium]
MTVRDASIADRSIDPRRSRLAALLGTLFVVACATETLPERGQEPAQTGADARPNYSIRLDSESSDPAEFQLVEDDDGIRIQTGPAGIAYRDSDVILTGDMHVRATFQQYDAPMGYREAYGIFVGGIDLGGLDLEYTYLLVRPTGDYLVKRRIGEITETLVDWTPHPSVQTVQAEGDQPLNTLGIDVFDGRAHFVVNGDEVFVESAARVRPFGIAGIRVNHRLDVRVDRWIMRASATPSQ